MEVQKTIQPVQGWAVLVGINNYIDQYTHPPLCCCVRDAIGLYVLLTHPDYGNFAPEHVLLLIDGTNDEVRVAASSVVQRMENEYSFSARTGIVHEIVRKRLFPEREDILAEIHRAAHNAKNDNLLLVHFASHGCVFDAKFYLVPPKARHPLYSDTAILLARLKDFLSQSKARRKVFILDACYSGIAAANVALPSNKELMESLFTGADEVAILTSCMPWEQCFEYDDHSGTPVHGLFTYYLLEGMMGVADTTGKGYVTLCDLYRHTDERVKTWVSNLPHSPTQTVALNGPDEVVNAPFQRVPIPVDVEREERLIKQLFSHNFQTRERAARSLGHLGSKLAVRHLKNLLESDDIELAKTAVDTLYHIPGWEAVQALRVGLCSKSDEVRRSSAWVIGERALFGDRENTRSATPDLALLLEDSSPSVRFETAHALGKIGGSIAINHLLTAIIHNSDMEVKAVALMDLKKWWTPLLEKQVLDILQQLPVAELDSLAQKESFEYIHDSAKNFIGKER